MGKWGGERARRCRTRETFETLGEGWEADEGIGY